MRITNKFRLMKTPGLTANVCVSTVFISGRDFCGSYPKVFRTGLL